MSADRRREAAEWLYSTIFRDEAIHLRQEAPKEPLPSLLQAARSLEPTKPDFRRSHDALFVQQAKLLEHYEDDYVYDRPVVRYYPTYQFLTDPELRGYFSWRTKLRKGDLRKTSLSYAFLYIYELLNQIGVEDPMDGYRKLKDFGAAYGALDPQINSYLRRWLTDYVVYYDLDPMLLADTPSVIFDDHLSVLANMEQYDPGKIMEAVTALSGRWLVRSKFYGEHRADMDTVITRVLRRISDHCARRCKKSMVEQYFGEYCQMPVILFESAVFHRRKKRADRDFYVDPVRTYSCKDGWWTVSQYDCPEGTSSKLMKLVKTVDSVMREKYAYRHPVKRELDTKWILKIIDEEVSRLQDEKKEAEARKITIDFSRLEGIRRDAAFTQDRLMVEEEAIEEPAPAPSAPTVDASETPLTPQEYRLLQCLLYGRDYSWVRSQGLMLSVLVDSINEKLLDEFADSVLTLDDRPEVIEDYIEDLKEMVHP